jgi:hypothetical protein
MGVIAKNSLLSPEEFFPKGNNSIVPNTTGGIKQKMIVLPWHRVVSGHGCALFGMDFCCVLANVQTRAHQGDGTIPR